MKYIRYVCNLPHPTVKDAELGMFLARDEIDFSVLKRSLQKAHEEAFYWFSKNGGGGLAYPEFRGKSRTYKVRKSLFWFKEDARWVFGSGGSVILRARELAKVLTEAGQEIREITIEDPGEIIWEDSNQILAFPKDIEIPKAF